MSDKHPGHLQKVNDPNAVARVINTTKARSSGRGKAIARTVENVGPHPKGWDRVRRERGGDDGTA